jgi:predicted RNA-binding protein YlqC (UPF0109 family)
MSSPAELVLAIAKSLVDQPQKVSARWVEAPEGSYVELTAAQEDRGKLIGRRGRTIESLRRLATAAFGREEQKVGVELAE